MGKKNPQPRRRKRSQQPPSIGVGGGEGFSIEIIDSLLIDGDPPPPPEEAGIANDVHNSSVDNEKSVENDVSCGKLNGVEKVVRSGKLNGVEKVSHDRGEVGQGFPKPGELSTDVENSEGGFSHPASTVENLASEETPRFFSSYSKLLEQGQALFTESYPDYPQCRPHPLDVSSSVSHLLRSRGVLGTKDLIKKYPLEIILDAINAVDAMINQGVEVHDVPKLIHWRLRRMAANGTS